MNQFRLFEIKVADSYKPCNVNDEFPSIFSDPLAITVTGKFPATLFTVISFPPAFTAVGIYTFIAFTVESANTTDPEDGTLKFDVILL
jgi:hypothetical protein